MADSFFALNPIGDSVDHMTGSPEITTVSGVATLNVAQTGNIGQGYIILAGGESYFISLVNSSTSFNVVTSTGGTPGDVEDVSVTSITPAYASVALAEAAYLTVLGNSNLTTISANPFFKRYYDDDDNTPDSSLVTISGATADDTNFLTIESPRGGTESINDQFPDTGLYDSTKAIMEVAQDCIRGEDNGVKLRYLQLNCTRANNNDGCVEYRTNPSGWVIEKCILQGNTIGRGIFVSAGATSGTAGIIRDNIIYSPDYSGSREAIYNVTGNCNIYFNTISWNGAGTGIRRGAGTVNAQNNISFNTNDDFNGSFGTLSYNADDDNTGGTNNVVLGTYSSIFEDEPNQDYNLLEYEAADGPYLKGITISGYDFDMRGTERDNSTPSMGALEFPSEGPTKTYALKKNNSGSGILVYLKKNNAGSGDDPVIKYNDDGTDYVVNTSGS